MRRARPEVRGLLCDGSQVSTISRSRNDGPITRPDHTSKTSSSVSPRCVSAMVTVTRLDGGYGRHQPSSSCVGGVSVAAGSSTAGMVIFTSALPLLAVSRMAEWLMPRPGLYTSPPMVSSRSVVLYRLTSGPSTKVYSATLRPRKRESSNRLKAMIRLPAELQRGAHDVGRPPAQDVHVRFLAAQLQERHLRHGRGVESSRDRAVERQPFDAGALLHRVGDAPVDLRAVPEGDPDVAAVLRECARAETGPGDVE